ncbi:predicted protein [Histoplasma capsulatum var. duboisii H88]|uniref:Predicted protein n=1 Tax=Ajellomyces capsulatus (strain H88) TaxID=544711 RepID=F0ULV0_AJEC8|nr:predicted protein [Histoplasma capsulatum var. duboisii H88]
MHVDMRHGKIQDRSRTWNIFIIQPRSLNQPPPPPFSMVCPIQGHAEGHAEGHATIERPRCTEDVLYTW